MDIRPFDPKEDIRAVERIWYECGWVEDENQAAYVKDFLSVGSCIVGCLDGIKSILIILFFFLVRIFHHSTSTSCYNK